MDDFIISMFSDVGKGKFDGSSIELNIEMKLIQ